MIPFGNVLWDSIYNQAIRKLHSPILTYLRPLHTRDWVPVTIPLHALALVGKVGPVQVRFTLHLRDQWSKRMQEGCKVYMDSYKLHGIDGLCVMVTWTIFKNHLLEVGLTQNRWYSISRELWELFCGKKCVGPMKELIS